MPFDLMQQTVFSLLDLVLHKANCLPSEDAFENGVTCQDDVVLLYFLEIAGAIAAVPNFDLEAVCEFAKLVPPLHDGNSRRNDKRHLAIGAFGGCVVVGTDQADGLDGLAHTHLIGDYQMKSQYSKNFSRN